MSLVLGHVISRPRLPRRDVLVAPVAPAMSATFIATSPATARSAEERLRTLPVSHLGVHAPTPFVFFIFAAATTSFTAPSLFLVLFLPFAALFRVEPIVKLYIKTMGHACLVLISHLTAAMLGNSE